MADWILDRAEMKYKKWYVLCWSLWYSHSFIIIAIIDL